MSVDHHMANIHAVNQPSDLIQLAKEAYTEAGFDPNWSEIKTSNGLNSYKTTYKNKIVNLTCDIENEINPHLILTMNFRDHLPPSNWEQKDQHREFFDASLELLCRLSDITNADYMGVYTRPNYDEIVPTDLPLADHIDKIPPIGVYSESLLQDFGGLSGLFQEPRWGWSKPPWRVGELADGRLLVISQPRPWTDGGWTDSSYVDLRPGEDYV